MKCTSGSLYRMLEDKTPAVVALVLMVTCQVVSTVVEQSAIVLQVGR